MATYYSRIIKQGEKGGQAIAQYVRRAQAKQTIERSRKIVSLVRRGEILNPSTKGDYVRNELGISDPEGFFAMRKKLEKSYGGMRFAFGKWNKIPCLFEFVVESDRPWYGGSNWTFTPQHLKWPATDTNEDRPCYYAGDIFYLRTQEAKSVDGIDMVDLSPGWKVLATILSGSEPKMATTGYQILSFDAKTDGTGWVTVQPGYFVTDTFVGFGTTKKVGVGERIQSFQNLSYLFRFRENMAPLKTIMKVNLFVAEFAASVSGGVLKNVTKMAVRGFITKRIANKFRARMTAAIPMATAAFLKAFFASLAKNSSKLGSRANSEGPHGFSKGSPGYEAVVDGVGSAIGCFVKEAIGFKADVFFADARGGTGLLICSEYIAKILMKAYGAYMSGLVEIALEAGLSPDSSSKSIESAASRVSGAGDKMVTDIAKYASLELVSSIVP